MVSFDTGNAQCVPSKNGGLKPRSYHLPIDAPASRAASSRIDRVFASAVNGLPFAMPTVLRESIITLSRVSHGSA